MHYASEIGSLTHVSEAVELLAQEIRARFPDASDRRGDIRPHAPAYEQEGPDVFKLTRSVFGGIDHRDPHNEMSDYVVTSQQLLKLCTQHGWLGYAFEEVKAKAQRRRRDNDDETDRASRYMRH